LSKILWTPSETEAHSSNIWRFLKTAESRHGISLGGYEDLWRWSVDRRDQFWPDLWDFADIIAESRGDTAVEFADDMINARFFPEARLNFAENILRRRDDSTACVAWREDGFKRKISWNELHASVSRVQQLLADLDVQRGDRVVAYLPNIPEALVFMLAAVSLGAVWSSCSPDFGVQGTLDRIGQIDPKVLVTVDGYVYGGKRFDLAGPTQEIVAGIPGLQHVIVVDYIKEPAYSSLDRSLTKKTLHYRDAVSSYDSCEVKFERLPFDQPAFILYTSGTTGKPKCILHAAGRALLKLLEEHILHFDVRPGDAFFYFTTTGWNMWYTLVSALGAGAVAVMYDGSPFQPNEDSLFNMVDEEGVTQFGTSPKYLDILIKKGVSPKLSHSLESIRTILSTGAPLSAAGFDYVYEHIKSDVRLSSISGGTEIMATFVNGNPLGPVRRGELQVPTLGMKTEVFDEKGNSVIGEQGELVCTVPFPSRPLCFWNDPGDRRYHGTYFSRYPNIWCHGDLAEITEHGGFIIHGRSDATLNPGGIRIGTSDIYDPVESLEVIVDSIVVGQRVDADEQVLLFVKLRPGSVLDDEIRQSIRDAIRNFATPRHVPAKIFQVDDIPYTINGKKSELAVRDVVHGHPVRNVGSIANPESLEAFRRGCHSN
jgi:acetoacetyl-CoA synthetase